MSVSLVRVPPVGQTQVYHYTILNLQKSTFVFFDPFFSPLLPLPTRLPFRNFLSAHLLRYVYNPLQTQVGLMLVRNFSSQLCTKDVHSCIGEKQLCNVLLDHGTNRCCTTRYTGEGMDVMEFTEAESNIQDLM